jgi:cell fate regulator YaaT (PSP1 superfamily)
MSRHHFVRVGALGHVGRFTAVDATRFPRGTRVIVRSSRGLEVGEVLAPCQEAIERGSGDGAILRGMTVEDDLLVARLEKNRDRAFRACQRQLLRLGVAATLMDVELLFDGRSVYFYFLGEVTAKLESITQELAQTFDSVAQVRRFAEAMTLGCGPDCGTEAATGGGCVSCETGCAVSGACTTRKRSA